MIITKVDLKRASPQERSDLNEILAGSNDATIFHTVEWNTILIEIFQSQNITLLAKKNGRPLGCHLLFEYPQSGPRKLYQSPDSSLETVYGGPITVNGIGDKELVRKELSDPSKFKCGAAMVRIHLPPGVDRTFLEQLGYRYTPAYTSILNLERSEEALFRQLHQKTRNAIRKARKSGVEIIKEGTSYLSQYYKMVQETLGTQRIRLLPEKFYNRVLAQLEPRSMAKLFIATHSGKAIAGAIFLFFKNTVYYWHGASFRDTLSFCPNELIQWELIQYARENRYSKYDLLYIDPDKQPGIARFKMRFGGETQTYYYAFWKTASFSVPVLAYCLKHPSYCFGRIRERIGHLEG